jgi:hypothetical protein
MQPRPPPQRRGGSNSGGSNSNRNNNINSNNLVDRPIMGGGNRTFASGRSSYNLNFIDLENEWERLDQEELDGLIDDEEEHEANLQRQWSTDYNEYLEELDQNNNNRSRGRALAATALEHGFSGLNPIVAASLKVVIKKTNSNATKSDSSENVCGVCLENITFGARIYDLKCLHQFHVDCLRPWLPRSSLCPMCRQEIHPKLEEDLKRKSTDPVDGNRPSKKK